MSTLTRNRRLLATGLATAAAVFAGTGLATAAQSEEIDNADLVALSGGGLLHYEVDGRVASQTVTIAGVKAQKVIRAGEDGAGGAYHALMSGKKLKMGGTYSVTVRVKLRNGETATLRDRLVVHRRHARRS